MTSLLMRFRKNPILNSFLSFVIALHFFFLLILFVSPTLPPHKKKHKPLIVKTIVSKPLTKTMAFEKKSPSHNASRPTQRSAPVPKQQQMLPKKEKIAEATAQASMTPSTKKQPAIADKQLSKTQEPPANKNPSLQKRAKISDSLLKELEESIAKIENKNNQGTCEKTFTPIPLQIDIPSSKFLSIEESQSDYTNSLVSHLHQNLSLPDYGEVKIQLSLRQDGTVAKVIVLKTQSEKNKQYLETHLPHLKFPHFDSAYANKKEYTFTLTFCNE
jgi:hypothetical protein